MKLTIDEKVCLKHKMTAREFLLALAIRSGGSKQDIDNMLNREIIIRDNGQLKVTQHWADVIEEILADSGNSIDDDRIDKLAVAIQECFPSGYKANENGRLRYYHKGSKFAVKQALKRFINYYGDYPDEEIINATKRYVASFRGIYEFPFQMANYFICKDLRNKGGDITSSLAIFLENKDDGSEDNKVIGNDILAKVV